MSDIQNRVEKVLQLEMDLDMQQDEYARLQQDYFNQDRPLKVENQELRSQINQLNLMIHKSVTDKQKYKIQSEQSDKQIESLKNKINDLNTKLKQQQQSLEKYKIVLKQA